MSRPETTSNTSVVCQGAKFPAELETVSTCRKIVETHLKKLNVDNRDVFEICLAVDEALSNAVEHGSKAFNHEIEFSFAIHQRRLEFSVKDYGGIVFNPEYFEKLSTVKSWGAGGRGILLLKNYMDEVYFVFNPGESTRVIMIKQLNLPGAAALKAFHNTA